MRLVGHLGDVRLPGGGAYNCRRASMWAARCSTLGRCAAALAMLPKLRRGSTRRPCFARSRASRLDRSSLGSYAVAVTPNGQCFAETSARSSRTTRSSRTSACSAPSTTSVPLAIHGEGFVRSRGDCAASAPSERELTLALPSASSRTRTPPARRRRPIRRQVGRDRLATASLSCRTSFRALTSSSPSTTSHQCV